jgi:hypothetical protein
VFDKTLTFSGFPSRGDQVFRRLVAFAKTVERMVNAGEMGAAQGQPLTITAQAAMNQLQL